MSIDDDKEESGIPAHNVGYDRQHEDLGAMASFFYHNSAHNVSFDDYFLPLIGNMSKMSNVCTQHAYRTSELYTRSARAKLNFT